MKSVPLIQKVARSALDKGIRELLLFFSIILLALPGFSQVDLVLSPASPTVNVGDPISIVLEVQAGTTDIVAVQAFLDYDPNLITVNSVDYEPGNEFPVLSGPTFSTLGQIDVAGNTFSTISGTFDLITINFTATAVGVASIDFHTPTGSSRVTDVADPAVQSVLGTTTGASINIIGPNAPPTVSITSPGNGTAFIEGANVVVIADASDSDGTITNVEFFDGVNSLGTDNTDPYSITITNIAQGTYSLTAVATDDDDESTTSSVVNITVNPAQVDTEPVITLDANATVNEGGNINVPLSILDADGDNLTISISSASNEPTNLQSNQGAGNGIQVEPFPFDASGFFTESNVSSSAGSYQSNLVFTPTFGDGGSDGDGSGIYTITVEVEDEDGNVVPAVLELTVNDVDQVISATGNTVIEAESFDNQGPANSGSGNNGIGVESNGGLTNIGFTHLNDFATYEIDVEAAGVYNIEFLVARQPNAARGMAIKSDGNTIGGIIVTGTGGWTTYETVSAQVTLPAGSQTLEFLWDNSAATNGFYFNIDKFTFGPLANQAPVFDLAISDQVNVEDDVVSLDGSATDPEGDNINYGATGLPTGLSINASTGEISGTIAVGASANSPYDVEITAADDGNPSETATQSFQWTVNSLADLPPTITPIADVEVLEGATVTVNIEINDDFDPSGSIVIYDKNVNGSNTDPYTSGAVVPGGDYSFADNGNGMYTLTWNTGAGDARAYLARVTADDGSNDIVTTDFRIDIAKDITEVTLAKTFTNPLPWYGPNPDGTLGRDVSIEPAGNIGYIDAGDFVEYLVNVPSTGPYTFRVNASKGNGTPGLLTISEEDGAGFSSLGTVTVIQNGWGNYADYTTSVTFTNTGLQTLRFDFGGGMNIEEFEFLEPSGNLPPVFTTEISDQNNLEGDTPIGLAVAANDPESGNITFSDNGTLPPGLSIDPNTGAISGTIDVGAAANSPYTVVITATDDGTPVESATSSFTWTVNTTVSLPLCINSGNQPSVTAFGRTFIADDYFGTPSSIFNKLNSPIEGTVPGSGEEDLFQSERFDNNSALTYAIPTGNGAFTVELYFAELFVGVEGGNGAGSGAGTRIFGVEIEGNVVETGIDLFDQYGPLVAATKTYQVVVSDGILNISLAATADNPKLNGLCITETATFNANQAPTVSIDPVEDILDCEGDGEDITLTATATDPEQGDMSAVVVWKDNNGNVVGTGATLDLVGFTGTATYTAEVTDATPSTDTEQITVTVIPNTVPTIDPIVANPPSITEGSSVSLSTIAADIEDASVTIEWSSDIETVSALGTGESINPTLTVVGTHTITASVTDACNQTAFVTTTVEVTAASNNPPILTIISPEDGGDLLDCEIPADGELVDLVATVSDVEDDDVTLGATISWEVNDIQVGTGLSVDDVTLLAGSNIIEAIVTDSDNNTVTQSVTIIVTTNTDPTIDPILAVPTTIDANQSVALSTTASDAEDGTPIINWVSDQEGALGTGASINPILTVLGQHTITATAVDACGATASVEVVVNVQQSGGDPPVFVGFISPSDGDVQRDCEGDGEAFNLNVSFTDTEDDAAETPLEIEWFDGSVSLGTGNPLNNVSLAVGSHTLSAVAMDSDGNSTSTTTSITVEVVGAPVFTITEGTVGGAQLDGSQIGTSTATTDVTVCWDVQNLDIGGDFGEHIHIRLNDSDNGQGAGGSANGRPYVRVDAVSGCFTFTDVAIGTHTVDFTGAETGHNELCEPTEATFEVISTSTDVFLVVNPEVSNVNENDVFDVTIEVQANAQQVDAVQMDLNFDPSVLQIVSITDGSTFDSPPFLSIEDNTNGVLTYAAGTLGIPPSGTFDLVTITFEAIGGPSSTLTFGNSTAASFQVVNVLTSTTDGIVNVNENPSLTITPDPILANLFPGGTTTVDYVVDANDASTLPSSAGMTLIDDANGIPATWATTVSTADQGVTYQVSFDATGLIPGTYTGILSATGVTGYDDATAVVTLIVDPFPDLVILPNPINVTVETEQSTTGSYSVETSDESQLPGDLLLSAVDDATSLTPTWLSLNPGNDGFEVDATGLAPGNYSATVTATGTGYNDGTTVINLLVTEAGVPCARVAFDTGGGLLGSSTFGGGLFINNNSTGSVNIVSVSIDLSTAVFPNMLFDPVGTAGDATASCVEIISQTGGDSNVGLTIPGNAGSGNDPDCVDPFSGEVVPGGYTIMTLDFTDFEPGEQVNIEVDVDPLSIIGFNAAGNAGAVAGTELIGSTVTVTYSDGSSATRQLYQVGSSQVNSENFFSPGTPQCAAPSLSVGGITGNGSLPETAQTATITGPANANVEVLVYGTTLEDLVIDPTTLDAFEMNKTQSLQEFSTTLNGAGTIDLALDLTGDSDSMLYYIVATVIPAADGCGLGACDISNVVRIKIDDTPAGDPCARIGIEPPSENINTASSFANNSIVFENNSTGNIQITSVSIDLSTAFFSNNVFDPLGTAGDVLAKCLTVNSQTGGDLDVGLTVPGDGGSGADPDCTTPFSSPNGTGGFNVMTLEFTDFEPGESIGMSMDIDPTSIEGFNTAGNAGAVSGLELIGATVTVTFSDGTSSTRELYQIGSSVAKSENFFNPAIPTCTAPSIELATITGDGTIFDPAQTLNVSGPANADIEILIVGTTLEDVVSANPSDPFEMNKAQSLVEITATLDGAGTLAQAINLTGTSDSMIYYIIATVIPNEEECGPIACNTSNVLRVKIEEDPTPIVTITDPVDGFSILECNDLDLFATASDQLNGDLSGSIIWTDLAGTQLGVGAALSFSAPLTIGTQTYIATVTNPQGFTEDDTVVVEVVANIPGTVAISTPLEGATVIGPDVNLIATALDSGVNVSSEIQWFDGLTPIGTGANITASLSFGTHTIIAKIEEDCGLEAADTITIEVIVDPEACRLESFTLVNAADDTDILTLMDGMTIFTGNLPTTALNIRANTFPAVVGSVAFTLTGPVNDTQSEGTAPYALFGDSGGDYNAGSLPVGTYTLTGQPYEGPGTTNPCIPLTITFTISDVDPCGSFIPSFAGVDPSDCGLADGQIVIGGLVPNAVYQVSIDGGTTPVVPDPTADINGEVIISSLAAGSYEVVLTEVAGGLCTASQTVALSNQTIPVINSVTPTDVTDCSVGDDGTITVDATGTNLEYSLDGITYQTENVFTGLSAGNYTVYVRENGAETCVATEATVINAPGAPVITLVEATDESDCGAGDGTITVSATGINLEYSIDGTNFQSSNVFLGLSAGMYTVTVREVGTTTCTATDLAEIVAPDAPVITNIVSSDESDCGAGDGTIIVSASGSSLEYSIDGNTFQLANSFTGLSAGIYTITVREVGTASCTVTGQAVISAPSAPTINNVIPTDITDCDLTDGTIVVSATGGTLEYSIDGANFQLANLFTGLAVGTYTVTVREQGTTDETCAVTAQATISEPEGCEGGGECTTPFNLALGKSTSQSAQYGDGASGFAVDGNTSGNNPWGASADLQHTTTAPGSWWSVDLGVLSTLQNVVIYNRSNPALYQRLNNFYVYTSASPIDGSQSNATLSSDPSINSVFFSGAAGAQETIQLGGVQGRYLMIKVTGNGPVHMAEVEVNGCDDTPPPVCDIDLVSVGSTDETDCGAADGTITLTATGNAEYSIDGGSTYQASNSFTGLSAGTYTPAIRKIGLASCTEVGATVTILAPDAPVITDIATTDQSDCEVLDGSITVTATGSNLEYSIGGAFQASNVFAGLAEGSYTVTVRDAGNTSCVATAQATVSKPAGCEGGGECTTPFNLALGKSTSQSAQYGDGASGFAVDGNTSGNNPWGASADLQHTATASGAWWSVDLGVLSTLKEIVIYNRSNPALYQRLSNFYVYTSASPIDGNQSNATLSSNPAINAEFFSGAAGAQETLDLGDVQGRYILIKLTGSGPLHMAEVEVNGCDDTPPPVCDIDLVSVGSTDETDCGAADGTITLTATGNAEYSIDGGSTYQASNSFTGLSAGTYTPAIRKIGLASCTEVGATVTILAPDAPVITNIATTDQSDCEVLDGSITVTATGSNLEYSIGGAFQASNFFAGLAEGSYTVTVRDAGNTSCVATAQVTISKPLGCEILCTTPINLTQEPGVGISQSSTYGDGVASLAIDGNTSGNNPWGSSADLQHTTTEAGAWLKVDLGQIGEIADITIYNRDGLQSRLNNFFIFYATDDIDADRPTVDLENDPSISNFFFPGGAGALEVIGLNQSQARYVVIKQSNIVNVTPLHIAEIQINGCPVATGGVNSGLRVAEGEVEEVLEEGINLSVYPNPYRENFTLEIEGNLEEGAHIEIHNALGQAVRSFPVPASKKVVLGKNLAMGVYWIQLFNGDSVERIKVMKAR